jgi:chemotaxis protein CheX
MKERCLKTFVNGAMHYFEHLSQESAEIQVPYLIEHDEPVIYDYTGIIGVSGAYRGYVYFTAPEPMMHFLLQTQEEPEHTEENCLDVVGEIANILAGNARQDLGAEFLISVPLRIAGQPDRMLLTEKSRSFAIPIRYSIYLAALVVSLERTP